MADAGVRAPKQPIDDVSKAIIGALQQDGRRSYSGIAESMGLSEAAVRQRVHRLVEAGVMQIVAVTDPADMGFDREALIGICCSGDSAKIAEKLAAVRAINYVVLTAGRFDLIVEAVCEDDKQLLDVLNTHIRALPEVYLVETLVYLKTVKQQYNWGSH